MKLTEIFKLHSPFRQTACIVSPPRTGSTLVFNLAKNCLPQYSIIKQHKYHWSFRFKKILVTIRDSFDSIASNFLASNREKDLHGIEIETLNFLNNGGISAIGLKNNSNATFSFYEKFYNNYEIIFEVLESVFNVKIDFTKRCELSEELSINTVLSKINHLDTFDNYDDETLFHGNHISQNKGVPGYGYAFFTDKERDIIQKNVLLILMPSIMINA